MRHASRARRMARVAAVAGSSPLALSDPTYLSLSH